MNNVELEEVECGAGVIKKSMNNVELEEVEYGVRRVWS